MACCFPGGLHQTLLYSTAGLGTAIVVILGFVLVCVCCRRRRGAAQAHQQAANMASPGQAMQGICEHGKNMGVSPTGLVQSYTVTGVNVTSMQRQPYLVSRDQLSAACSKHNSNCHQSLVSQLSKTCTALVAITTIINTRNTDGRAATNIANYL